MPAWLDDNAGFIWRPYCQHKTAPPPLPVVGAKGSRLKLADGAELVDGIASWWTACHGYQHGHIRARIDEQMQRLMHVAFGGLAQEAAYTLAGRLIQMLPAPLQRVFFVESGSVAVEVALKMCIQSWKNRGYVKKTRVVAFEGAYHGDTFMTMRLGDPSEMHSTFASVVEPMPATHLPVPRDDDGGAFERALEQVAAETACVIIEPLVQAAGGMRFHPPEVLSRIRKACDELDLLLVFDEIATGFFRTGAPFAMFACGVVPDVVTLGKALTGGSLPLACAVATEDVFSTFLGDNADTALQHGPTYMGNALACAAAHASLDLFQWEHYDDKVFALQKNLAAGLEPLRAHEHVREVRTLGAIGVVEMEPGTAPPSAAFARHGAFVRPLRGRAADVVYVMPPLVIEPEDQRVLVDAIRAALG
jgi:adenosylmethionine-8-amino-7-oxononanoate aminotransferase